MPKVGMRLRLRLGASLPLDLIPEILPKSPSDLSALAWWDSDNGVTDTAGEASAWQDRIIPASVSAGASQRPDITDPGVIGDAAETLEWVAGNSDRMSLDSSSWNSMGVGDGTLAIVIKPTSTGSTSGVFNFKDSAIAVSSFALLYNSSDRFYAEIRDAGGLVQAIAADPFTGAATWVIAVKRGDNLTLHTEAGQVSVTGASSHSFTANRVEIGWGARFSGDLRDAAAWPTALGEDAMESLKAWLRGRI